MEDGVAQGVFRLSHGSDDQWEGTRFWRDWIKRYYARIGHDPKQWRADVLEFGHERGWLDDGTPFAVVLSRLYMRLRMHDETRQVGAANDSDLYGPHPDHWTLESFRTWRMFPLRDRDLPVVKASPFARMARVRLWSHTELVANLSRPVPQ